MVSPGGPPLVRLAHFGDSLRCPKGPSSSMESHMTEQVPPTDTSVSQLPTHWHFWPKLSPLQPSHCAPACWNATAYQLHSGPVPAHQPLCGREARGRLYWRSICQWRGTQLAAARGMGCRVLCPIPHPSTAVQPLCVTPHPGVVFFVAIFIFLITAAIADLVCSLSHMKALQAHTARLPPTSLPAGPS